MYAPAAPAPTRTLFVDLDGTLLATDLLWETLLILIRRDPCKLVFLPLWLMKGKAHFKQQLAHHVVLNPATLPYHEDVLQYLKHEKAQGRQIVLATGSDRKVAEAVGKHIGVFSAILASDGTSNLVGPRKLNALRCYTNGGGFDYVGNSKSDLSLWKSATEAMVVQPSSRLVKKIRTHNSIHRVFSSTEGRIRVLIRALRVHQWVKNVLLFVPLVLAHKIFQFESVLLLLYAFVSFSLCAASVYVVNDLLDLDSDRRHPKKKLRPFAAGDLPLWTGFILVPCLIFASFLIAGIVLNQLFTATLAVYLALSTGYSLYWKRMAIVDVLILAGLYAIRMLAGAIAVGVHVSPWLLAFSIFIFFSLALIKRYSELSATPDASKSVVNGRGYYLNDKGFLLNIGVASGYLSLLVFTFYLNSPDVITLYHNPQYLWLVCPLLLYWVTRIWLVAYRNTIVEDPLVFTLKDPASYAIGMVIGLVILIAL